MDIAQFGQTIKQKYPQYQDMDDADLGQRMLSKYPQYQDMVTAPTQPVQPEQDPDTGRVIGLAKSYARPVVSTLQNTAKLFGYAGAKASVPEQEIMQDNLTTQYEQLINMAKTASPIEKSSLLTKAREIQGRIGRAGVLSKIAQGIYETPDLDKAYEALKSKTPYEKQGGFVGDVSQMFIGGGAAKGGAKAIDMLATKGTGFIPAVTRIGGSLLGAIPGATGTALTTLAQQKSPENAQEAISGIKKAGIAGATDFLLAGTLQTAKEVFGSAKRFLWKTAIPPNQKKEAVRQIIESEKKWDDILAPQKDKIGVGVEKAKKETKEVVSDWYAQNAPNGSSTELAGWSKSYMKNKVEPSLQQFVKKASPVKVDKKFVNTLLDNLEEGYNEALEPEKLKVVQELKRQLNFGIPDIEAGSEMLAGEIGENTIPAELALRLKRLFGGVAYEKGFKQASKMTPKRQAFAKMAVELRKSLGLNKEVDNLIGVEEKLYDGFNSLVKAVGKEMTPAQGLFGFYDLPALTGTFITGNPGVLALNELLKQGGRLSRTTWFKTGLANMLGGASKNIAPESLVGQVIRKSSANAIND